MGKNTGKNTGKKTGENTERKVICFLAPANNAHTLKWCRWFYERGYIVHLISFTEGSIENVKIHIIDNNIHATDSDLHKLKYIIYAPKVRRLVEKISPDILSVHYASSYGLVAALSNIKNYTLSVWGTDIFGFPRKSIIHKLLLKFSLNKAKQIMATSEALARETKIYTNKPISITPFGIDTDLFHETLNARDKDVFTVGTIKALTPLYGIDYLIKAIALIDKEHPEIPIQLRIAGRGKNEDEYKSLVHQLGMDDKVVWTGYLNTEEVAAEWGKMDLGVLYSAEESFGVAALEAQACGIPLIVSDAPGFYESTSPGITSIVVPFGNARKLADAIVNLYGDEEKRNSMAVKGRDYVLRHYEINECFFKIEKELSEL